MPWTGPQGGARQQGPDRPIGRVADGARPASACTITGARFAAGPHHSRTGSTVPAPHRGAGLVGAHVAAVIDAEPGKRPPALCCIRGLGVANDGADPLPWVQVQPHRRKTPERQGGRGVNLVLAGCATDRLGDQEVHLADAAGGQLRPALP
jgi:hypothetical protein